MKGLIHSLSFFLIAAVSFGLQAEDLASATNQAPKLLQELQVRLQKADYIPTRRLSARYVFAIEGKLPPDQATTTSIHLFAGADVDNHWQDSIARLNAFFDAGLTNSVPEGPLAIRNTNIVTLKIFESGWLFRDGRGRTVAIGKTNAPEWMSKRIFEEFGSVSGGVPNRSETNSPPKKDRRP
jgi:hypothetical protein